ncbi:MAG: MCE family protein [Fibrobacteraceae bacterium]|nr:MCE family protein [Fibrobacteraceae bacterium]
MNRFTRLLKENLLASIIFLTVLVGCCAAWYFLHPSSPYHPRYSFVVKFDAVGTLSPGNRVEVRGIKKGEIMAVELSDDAVYVTARVLADTKIPVNSAYRLITSGLMGERELCVLTGDAKELIADGDTVVGHYDEGTSGIGKSLSAIIEDLDSMKVLIASFIDSVTVGSDGKQIEVVLNKGKKLIRHTKDLSGEWKSELKGVLDHFNSTLEKAEANVNEALDRGEITVENAEKVLNRADALLSKVQETKDYAEKVVGKVNQKDNSVGLILDKNGEISLQLDRLVVDTEQLIADIKKNGIKLNIDIFN